MPANQIWIWKVGLHTSKARTSCYRLLDAGERLKAGAFKCEEARRRYVVAHAALRILAGRLSNAAPMTIRLRLNAFGKPELGSPRRGLHFSLSHAGELALIAFSRGGAIGVDVELIDEELNPAEVSRRFVDLDPLVPAGERTLVFYRRWVHAEACGKIGGYGLSRLINSGPCQVYEFAPAAGYIAAVAVPSQQALNVRAFDFLESDWAE